MTSGAAPGPTPAGDPGGGKAGPTPAGDPGGGKDAPTPAGDPGGGKAAPAPDGDPGVRKGALRSPGSPPDPTAPGGGGYTGLSLSAHAVDSTQRPRIWKIFSTGNS